ncbi:hypothetical protein [Streptomyces sp. NPDC058694]|uniref:hypothetical protein n=1 Tax=Streptomyces sp. NPDC058694 TaxID=3346603 RepID=UPI00365DB231
MPSPTGPALATAEAVRPVGAAAPASAPAAAQAAVASGATAGPQAFGVTRPDRVSGPPMSFRTRIRLQK